MLPDKSMDYEMNPQNITLYIDLIGDNEIKEIYNNELNLYHETVV